MKYTIKELRVLMDDKWYNLSKQGTIDIALPINRYNYCGAKFSECPNCSSIIGGGFYDHSVRNYKYCPYCGEPIYWESDDCYDEREQFEHFISTLNRNN